MALVSLVSLVSLISILILFRYYLGRGKPWPTQHFEFPNRFCPPPRKSHRRKKLRALWPGSLLTPRKGSCRLRTALIVCTSYDRVLPFCYSRASCAKWLR